MRNRSSRQFEADSLEMSVRFIFPARFLRQTHNRESRKLNLWGEMDHFLSTNHQHGRVAAQTSWTGRAYCKYCILKMATVGEPKVFIVTMLVFGAT